MRHIFPNRCVWRSRKFYNFKYMDIKILFEDAELLVVDKPAGLMVHSDGRTSEKTLVDWLLENKKVSADIGEPWTDSHGRVIPRPGIVHRLDKDTSGVLVIAKTQQMYEWLKSQFKDRKVIKKYEAIVHGVIKEDGGIIDRPIGRSGADFRKKSAQRGALGTMREAVTEYKVLHRFDPVLSGPGYTHVALFPKTGRTHQLRVHMKAINHPILLDPLYGGKKGLEELQTGADIGDPGKQLHLSALALRAVSIAFSLPDGRRVDFGCEGYGLSSMPSTHH